MKIIELQKDFGDFKVNIADWEIRKGRIHAVIGPNGCGKTATAKLLMGIIHADRCTVDLEGVDRREMTLAGQKPYMLHDSVYNNLIYPLKIRKVKPNPEEVDYWLELCGLENMKRKYAPTLSSGQQQKLSIARALIFRPKIIIIDESLSNLDPDSVDLFENAFLKYQSETPATWMIISHQLAHINKLCEEVHFMSGGRVVQSGETRDILFHSQNADIVRFLRHETLRDE